MEVAQWFFDHLNALEYDASAAMSSNVDSAEALRIWQAYASQFPDQMQPFVPLRMDAQRISHPGDPPRRRILFQIRLHRDVGGTFFEAWVGDTVGPPGIVGRRIFAREVDFALVLAGFEDVCDDCYGVGLAAGLWCSSCLGRGWIRPSGWVPVRLDPPLETLHRCAIESPRQAVLAQR